MWIANPGQLAECFAGLALGLRGAPSFERNVMSNRILKSLAVAAALAMTGSAALSQQPRELRWGTPPVGTSGHKALVTLARSFVDLELLPSEPKDMRRHITEEFLPK